MSRVDVEEYDHVHDCITIDEVRWILRYCRRGSPYYTYFLLRATTGVRGSEILNWTINHFTPDLKSVSYRVDKPAQRLNRHGEEVVRHKHRIVRIDDWVIGELRTYFDTFFGNNSGVYQSPFGDGKLFPMKNNKIVISFWYKLRRRMEKAGMNSFRLWKLYKRPNRNVSVFVLRPHIFRHFAASVMYYRLNKDIKATQEWIKHEDSKTTSAYIHSAESLNSTEEELKGSWAAILDLPEAQENLSSFIAPEQTPLTAF